MFGKRIDLFKLLGFEVRIDMSWVVLAILVAWSLSTGFFPFRYEGLSAQTYWMMGIVGAIGLFVSIIVHEMAHSLVARQYGMPITGITLFIFGGVAEMNKEPSDPRAEFMTAAAGPIASLVLAGLLYALASIAAMGGLPESVYGVVKYLAWINGLLAVFNLIPAFPLDGGRLLRAVLWARQGNLRRATRIAAGFGAGFGLFLLFLGVLQFVGGNFIGGMWWFFIGLFIRSAAAGSYRQLLVRKALAGERVRRFMKTEVIAAPPSVSLQELVDNYFYRYHHKLFPVVAGGGRLLGGVSIKQVRETPREEWGRRTVGEIAQPPSPENTIDADADALEALALMSRSGSSRLMVTTGRHLVGIISLKDMLAFLELKVELEQ